MSTQYRPKDAGPEALMYAPERDIAYIGPSVLLEAVNRTDAKARPQLLNVLMAKFPGTDDVAVQKAAEALGSSQKRYLSCDSQITTPNDALQSTGFFELPDGAQLVLFASCGMSLIGAWFEAVRDATRVGQPPAAAKTMARLIAGARLLSFYNANAEEQYVKIIDAEVANEKLGLELQAKDCQIRDLKEKLLLASQANKLLTNTLTLTEQELKKEQSKGIQARIGDIWQKLRSFRRKSS